MSQIGRYEIVRKTGNHGLDALYEAFDPLMKRSVTIRMADRTTDPGVSVNRPADFDVRQIAALDHPNIVKVLACEETEDTPYLVLEPLEGIPLSQLISDGKRISRQQIIAAFKMASSAIDHAHARGLLHAHLTTECLLVKEDGLLKVNGFDVARPAEIFHSNVGALQPATLMNAIPYMSPELVQGDPMDGRADQFSLACIALEALTGVPLFGSKSPLVQMREIVFENPDLASIFGRHDLPSALTRVFEKALAKVPDARFASCGEFAAALEMALTVKPIPAATRLVSTMRSVTATIPLRVEWTRYRLLLIGGALTGMAFVVMTVYFVFRTPPTKPVQRIAQPSSGSAPRVGVPASQANSAVPSKPSAKASAAPAKVEVRTAPTFTDRKAPEPVTRTPTEAEPEKMRPVEPRVVQ